MEQQMIFSVSEANNFIKALLDRVPQLQEIFVRGEISNYKLYPSGHHYFTLKDAEGAMRCVLFKGNALRLRFRPENGMKVIAFGRISVFPRDGAYQLYVSELSPEGAGDLHVAFEQLKAQLEREGLFDPAHKKPLPKYPKTIAIITSPAGAAVHDMLRILRARWPLTEVKLLGVRVQGTEAPPEIAGALRYANRYKVADLIITGRGGGSIEDLWAFNDERVARAIYDSEIPVISAVGHEPDVTIADYVADLRAATGVTVVLITHHMDECIDADRLLVMSDGKLVLDGAPKDVFSRVEQMRSIGLDVPATTETLYELRAAGADVPLGALSDAEAADAIVRWLGN